MAQSSYRMSVAFVTVAMSSCLVALSTDTVFAGSTSGIAAPPSHHGVVEVSTAGELEYIDKYPSSYLTDNIKIMTNIDLSGYAWNSLGSTAAPFSGQFDGQGYSISGVSVTNTGVSHEVGFFGTLDGQVSDLNISGTVTVGQFSNAGLLAGEQNGGSIINSSTAGSVSAPEGGSIGGLVGNQAGGSIQESFSNASVTGGFSVGGLVGNQNGMISNSYATGTTNDGSTAEGGLVGLENAGSITDSYATGSLVNGIPFDTGGLIGDYNTGTNTNDYFLQTSPSESGAGFAVGGSAGDVKGLSTNQFALTNSFTGFDFTNTWGVSKTINNGYPYLLAFYPGSGGIPGKLPEVPFAGLLPLVVVVGLGVLAFDRRKRASIPFANES